jgi:uncharacterized membrane protein
MERVVFRRPSKTKRTADLTPMIHWVLFGLFLAQFVLVWLRLWPGSGLFGLARWPEGLLLALATATTLVSLARELPGQNVLLASAIIAFIGSLVQTVGTLTAVPFGPYVYTESMGQQLFHPLPWSVPFLWIVMVMNSRGVARLILKPWRKVRTYGFWVIGVAISLVIMLDLGLEPFATKVKHFWLWLPTKSSLDWYSTPWVNFLGWAVTTLFILVFATPALINKRSVKHPPDYHPLIVWLLMNVLFATAAITHQFWVAAGLVGGASVLVAFFALRGAEW